METNNRDEMLSHAGLDDFKTEHLLLLVGKNPLPNAIAGWLLAKDGATVTLIYSRSTEHSSGTGLRVDKLRAWFARQPGKRLTLESQDVEEANPTSIFQGVLKALQKFPNAASIGLNYTGGTKAMSIHAYRAVEHWIGERKERNLTVRFSYLDARTLRMILDPASAKTGEKAKEKYVGLLVEPALGELLALHGWTTKHAPATTPILPETALQLLKIHEWDDETSVTKQDLAVKWRVWLEGELFKKARRKERLSVSCARSPDGKDCEVEIPGEKWLSQGQLKDVVLSWQCDHDLVTLAETMKSELGLNGNLVIGEAADKCGYRKALDFCKWLNGVWLEHALLRLLSEVREPLSLHDCAQNVETDEVQFDMDVIAMRGYQVFAFSCSTDTEKTSGGTERMKKKLFEAYIRARQLGGDEARVALVCCSTKPKLLEDEMRRDIDSEGGIRVFGRRDFSDLKGEITRWIESQKGKEAGY